MATHQLSMATQQGGHPLTYILMRGSMKSVLGDALFQPERGHPVEPRVLRHGGMKLRLECRHNRNPRHGLTEGLDGCQVNRVMRRRGGQKLAERLHHALIHYKCAAI